MKSMGLSALFCLGVATSSAALAGVCENFSASTMNIDGADPAEWRVDFPAMDDVVIAEPWKAHDFATDPRAYMLEVLEAAKSDFRRVGSRLVGTGTEEWWIVPWMDYPGSAGNP